MAGTACGETSSSVPTWASRGLALLLQFGVLLGKRFRLLVPQQQSADGHRDHAGEQQRRRARNQGRPLAGPTAPCAPGSDSRWAATGSSASQCSISPASSRGEA